MLARTLCGGIDKLQHVITLEEVSMEEGVEDEPFISNEEDDGGRLEVM